MTAADGFAKLYREKEEWLRNRPAWQSKHWMYLITHVRYTNGLKGRVGELETTYKEMIEHGQLKISVESLRKHYQSLIDIGAISVRRKAHGIVIAINPYHSESGFSQNLYHPETPAKYRETKGKRESVVKKSTTHVTTHITTHFPKKPLNTDTCDMPKKEERIKNNNIKKRSGKIADVKTVENSATPFNCNNKPVENSRKKTTACGKTVEKPVENYIKPQKYNRLRDNPKIGSHEHFFGRLKK